MSGCISVPTPPVPFVGGSSDECALTKGKAKDLRALIDTEFAFESKDQRERFARAAVTCVGVTDPEIRDELAYAGFAAALREGVSDDVVRDAMSSLLVVLEDDDKDANKDGFAKPFAVLMLAEVARADRMSGVLTTEQRDRMIRVGAEYLRTVDDYRGYSEKDGWRHGVAHGADLMMQAALNPKLQDGHITLIMDAVAAQVAPRGRHFYVFGEGQRLARPILFLAGRGALTDESWARWFSQFSNPEPLDNWADVFSDMEGLAKLHNTKEFVQAVYINGSVSPGPQFEGVTAAALETLRQMP